MRRLFFFLLGILHLSDVVAADYPVDYSTAVYNKKTYEAVLMRSSVESAPVWNSTKAPPPLPAKRAVQLALAALDVGLRHSSQPLSPAFELNQVALVALHESDFWYYRVSCTATSPGSGGRLPIVVFVTMDGKVIPLREKK